MEHSSGATYYNVHLRDSDIIILKYDNISKNECSSRSVLFCAPYIGSSVSYISFENNTSTYNEVIEMNSFIKIKHYSIFSKTNQLFQYLMVIALYENTLYTIRMKIAY